MGREKTTDKVYVHDSIKKELSTKHGVSIQSVSDALTWIPNEKRWKSNSTRGKAIRIDAIILQGDLFRYNKAFVKGKK